MISSEVSYHVLLGRPCLHKRRLIPLTYHQCVKGRLNEKPIRIAANPSPFNQNEVNFIEIMFYGKLALAEEYPISKTLGAPIPEEEDEESNNHDMRNFFGRKRRKKKEANSSDSWRCVIIQKPEGRHDIAYKGTWDMNAICCRYSILYPL